MVRIAPVALVGLSCLVVGCADSSTAEASVGSAGGTVRHPSGAILEVPAGALAETIALTVRSGPAPDGNAYSEVWTFGPPGTVFAKPVTVSIPYTAGQAAPAFWWSDQDTGSSFAALSGATFSGGTATASVEHFSRGFIGPVVPGPCNRLVAVGAGSAAYSTDVFFLEPGTWSRTALTTLQGISSAWGYVVPATSTLYLRGQETVGGEGNPVTTWKVASVNLASGASSVLAETAESRAMGGGIGATSTGRLVGIFTGSAAWSTDVAYVEPGTWARTEVATIPGFAGAHGRLVPSTSTLYLRGYETTGGEENPVTTYKTATVNLADGTFSVSTANAESGRLNGGIGFASDGRLIALLPGAAPSSTDVVALDPGTWVTTPLATVPGLSGATGVVVPSTHTAYLAGFETTGGEGNPVVTRRSATVNLLDGTVSVAVETAASARLGSALGVACP